MFRFSIKPAIFAAALAFLPIISWADARPTADDFAACFEKLKPSIVSVNGAFGVAIAPDLVVVPKNSETTINSYLKFDPFLQVYLVQSQQKLEPVNFVDETDDALIKRSTWVGVLGEGDEPLMGHIERFSKGLGELDTLSFDSPRTGLVSSACCKPIGIAVGENKFIGARYLRHLAAYPDVYYGDISVRFEDKGDSFVVAEVDPLGRGRALSKGDEVLSINGKKPTSLRELNEIVLFAKKGSELDFLIRRNDERISIKVPVSGAVDFSFDSIEPQKKTTYSVRTNLIESEKKQQSPQAELVQNFGITLDSKLVVKKVVDGSAAAIFGVEAGDRLLQVGDIAVASKAELENAIGDTLEPTLLLRRGEFDYFVKVGK